VSVLVISVFVSKTGIANDCVMIVDSLSLCYGRKLITMCGLQLFICENLLEQEGVFGLCELDDLHLDLLTLDNDILSMEAPDFFKTLYLVRIFVC